MKTYTVDREKIIKYNKSKGLYFIHPYGIKEPLPITHCPWCGTDLALFEKIGVKALWIDREPETRYCCKRMKKYTQLENPPVSYDKKNREYFLTGDPAGRIANCPWCALDLPTSLKSERRKILNELGFASDDGSSVPDEFKTDEWWLRRGIW